MKFLVLLCLLGSALAEFSAVVNSMADFQLSVINAAVRKMRLSRVPLGDRSMFGYEMKGMYLEDLSTLKRTGDAVVKSTDARTMSTRFSFGLGKLSVGLAQLNTPSFNLTNARFDVGENSLTMEYSVAFPSADQCELSWDRLTVDHLDQVILRSDQPEFDGFDVTPYWAIVKDNLNAAFESDYFRNAIKRYNPCQSDSVFSRILRPLVHTK